MGRRSKKDRPPAAVQAILSDNLVRLRDRVYANLPHQTARNKALANDSDMSPEQVRRIIVQEVAPGIDTLERLSRALGCRPFQLLEPYFGAEETDAQDPSRPGTANESHAA